MLIKGKPKYKYFCLKLILVDTVYFNLESHILPIWRIELIPFRKAIFVDVFLFFCNPFIKIYR